MDILALLDTLGIEEEAVLAASEEGELQRFREFRHEIQEAINHGLRKIRNNCPGIYPRQVAVGSGTLSGSVLIRTIREILNRFSSPAYGISSHYASGEVFISFFPENKSEAEWLQTDLLQAADVMKDQGILPSRGFGAGKLNRPFMEALGAIPSFEKEKERFDPEGRLNPPF